MVRNGGGIIGFPRFPAQDTLTNLPQSCYACTAYDLVHAALLLLCDYCGAHICVSHVAK